MGTNKKGLCIVFCLLLICVIVAGGYLFWHHSLSPESLSAESTTVAQIKTFTQESKEDNGYHYSYTCTDAEHDTMEKWSIYFVEDNSFVRFYDQDLYEKIEALFGADTVEEGHAIYAYSDDRYSIYFKDEIMDGIIMISFFQEENRLEQMEKDNAEVNEKLEENGIDVTQLKTINAADCELVNGQNNDKV